MPNARLTHEEIRTAREANARLQPLAGIPLQVCVFRETWRALPSGEAQDNNSLPTQQPGFLKLLPQPHTGDPRPFCQPTPANTFLIGIPIDMECDAVVYSVGETVAGLETLLETVSRQSREISVLRNERLHDAARLDSFADQVIQDFEERNWLVELTEHLEMCDVHHDISDVAEGLLPYLKAIIGARVVAFVPADVVSDECESRAGRIVQCAERQTEKYSVREIVEHFQHDVRDQPLVRNWSGRDGDVGPVPGLSALMIAGVSRERNLVGWLIAANRQRPGDMPVRAREDRDDIGRTEDEFGTTEAGLLRSAAMVLATHHHNLTLFRANQVLTVNVVRSLANAVDARDAYTHGHSDRVARMARHLARRIGAGPHICEQILMTGLLHDIGKIGVPDRVLLKAGRLDDEEFAMIKQHPVIGHRILRHIAELAYTLEGVLYHHEAWSGQGYPEGLTGLQIPLFARILAVVDSYDAMTSCRPYRHGMSFEKAEQILREGAGSQWDPALVETFLRHREEFRAICGESTEDSLSLAHIDMRALAQVSDSTDLEAVLKRTSLCGVD